jgi:hypothetical protein
MDPPRGARARHAVGSLAAGQGRGTILCQHVHRHLTRGTSKKPSASFCWSSNDATS